MVTRKIGRFLTAEWNGPGDEIVYVSVKGGVTDEVISFTFDELADLGKFVANIRRSAERDDADRFP